MKNLSAKNDFIGTIIFLLNLVNFIVTAYCLSIFEYGVRQIFPWQLYFLLFISFLLIFLSRWLKFVAFLFSILTFFSLYESVPKAILTVQTLNKIGASFLEITLFILFVTIIFYSFYSITIGNYLKIKNKAILK